ncbi:MAG: hypothetical protein CR986_05050 [Ignavibacteriae bacterium]|nr:MAG: hypothetical protein CR986_05050 [Ignavibacteriota bacterium]
MFRKLKLKPSFNYFAFIIIISSSIFLGIIYNLISVDGIPFIRKPIKVTSQKEEVNENNILEVNLAQVIQLRTQINVIIIDARDQWDYAEAHIEGAVSIPEFSFTKNNHELSKISRKEILIIYCSGDDCNVSKRLAQRLIKLGYKNTYVYLGGIEEWENANLPIATGNTNE